MKRVLCVLLTFALLLGLTACGHQETGSADEGGANWQEQYDLGMKYVSDGNYEEAIIAFTAAIEIDPKQAEVYVQLAEIYKEQGDMEKLLEILQQGKAETGDLYWAFLALDGSLSPKEEPELELLSVFEDMEYQEGTNTVGNSLAADFLWSEYMAFPELVMEFLEPVLEAGRQEDPETLCALLQEDGLWEILYSVFGWQEYNAQPNEDDMCSLTIWTQWDDAVIQLQCLPYIYSDELTCNTFSIQYRPESGKGFALAFNPLGSFGERSCTWLSGEVSGYLFNGSFVRKEVGVNGEFTAEGTAVNELVDGEYCQKGWIFYDEYYQFDMGKMLAPWTNDLGEACCIKEVDVTSGHISYGAVYDWAMEGREGWLMYPFHSPWVG